MINKGKQKHNHINIVSFLYQNLVINVRGLDRERKNINKHDFRIMKIYKIFFQGLFLKVI